MTDSLLTMLYETGSTNDDALALGRAGARHGRGVAARLQTAGRGRRGHAWESPVGNLYLSVVLRPHVAPSRLPGLAAACGLGVTDALREVGCSAEVRLKWPNDLLVRGRKLAGILVEAARDDSGEPFAVCGVGVNVGLSPRGLDAISLAELGEIGDKGVVADCHMCDSRLRPLCHTLRAGIVARVDAWAAGDGTRPLDGILDDYLERLCWLGEKVCVLDAESGSELAQGALDGVDPWGRAVIDGTPYPAERVSLRPA